jgi:hypothetical protein
MLAAVALLLAAGAQAVHDDGFFELGPTPTNPEGGITNILGNATDPGPDWADLFTATGALTDSDNDGNPDFREVFGGHAAAFIADPSSAGGALDPSTFSGFGTSNKNNDPISDEDCANRTPPLTGSDCAPWGWDPGNVPAKDDLTNVYSYEKISPANNHLLLYAGVEREDPSGDSHVDIEYFQDKVSLGDPDTNPERFDGLRTVNDVIVVMDYRRGGAIGSVSIRRWNGTEYVQVGLAGGEGCFSSPGGAADSICAFNNGANINGGPWPNYDNHGKVITTLAPNAFTEIGVDLTELIGASPCISTFMGKTRSSASFTAELKDFAGPQNFDVCQPSTDLGVSASTTIIHSGDSVTLTFTEANDGNETLLTPTVTTDNPACTPTFSSGDTDSDGKLDPGETWSFTCTFSPTGDTTVVATGSGVGELSGKTVTFCTVPPNASTICDEDERASISIDVINPGTELVKKASVTVTYRYEETNDGDVPLSSPTVTDNNCTPVTAVDANSDGKNDGDTDADGVFDPAETWLFACSRAASTLGADVDVTNIAVGSGVDSLGSTVTFCTDPANPPANTICDQEERDRVRVQVTHLPGGAG